MNTNTRFLILLAAVGALLLTCSLCFSEEVEMGVLGASAKSPTQEVIEGGFDIGATNGCIIRIDHEDYVMGMDGYYESLVESKV